MSDTSSFKKRPRKMRIESSDTVYANTASVLFQEASS